MTPPPDADAPAAATVAAAADDPARDAQLSAEAALVERHEHPSDGTYWLIAFGLAVLTGIEVGIYYLKHDTATTVVLLILMALKFVIVVGFFMHLKFDSPVLRRLFSGGLILAMFIYFIVFFMFGVFHI